MLRKEVDIVNWEILVFVKELKLTRSGVCWNGASDFTDSIYGFQVGRPSKTTTVEQNKNPTHLLTVTFANRLERIIYRPKENFSQGNHSHLLPQ